ncbi:MAG TPA: hypothetical protein VG870_02835, partial [Chitinophagaceae bacterium]|nr:hypothetical protein [Chitinophagaceae bacterium]
MLMRIRLSILFLILITSFLSYAQQDSTISLRTRMQARYISAINRQSEQINTALAKKSKRVLRRFFREQKRLQRKLAQVDSLSANSLGNSANERLQQLQSRLLNPGRFSQFMPRWDSLSRGVSFLSKHSPFIQQSESFRTHLKNGLASVDSLETALQRADDIKHFLKTQQQQWQEVFNRLGMTSQLKKLNKEVYYYSQQIREYKELLNQPNRLEKKVLEVLSQTELFRDFMKRNSMLASLFRLSPDDPNDPAYLQSLAGLQTRSQINQLIQNQLGSGGPNSLQTLQNNIAQAQSQLQGLKDRITRIGGSSSDMEMPEGFTPNNQKTKTFLQRLVFGTNFQTLRSTSLFPVTSDLGLSIGFKPNDRSILGIGASYKVGWGHSFRNIRVTNQGAGLRSFVDWKIRGNFWLSGGYELNYRTIFYTIDQLKELNAWQQSGLLGLSKKFSVRMKLCNPSAKYIFFRVFVWDILRPKVMEAKSNRKGAVRRTSADMQNILEEQ